MNEEKHFTSGAICKVAGIGATTLNTWRARKILEFPKNNSLEWTRYSEADAMTICLLSHLIRSGLETKIAAQIATGFREEKFFDKNFAIVFDVAVDLESSRALPPYKAVFGPRSSTVQWVAKNAEQPVFHCVDLKRVRDMLHAALQREV